MQCSVLQMTWSAVGKILWLTDSGLVYSSHSHHKPCQTVSDACWAQLAFGNARKLIHFFTLTYPLATWLLNHYPQPWLKCCIRWFQQKLSHVYPPSQGSPGMFWVSRSVCLTCFLWWWPNDPINSPWIKDPRNNCIRVHIRLIFQICKIIHTWEKLLNYGSAISQVQKLALAP